MKSRNLIFLTSLIFTVAIFSAGFGATYYVGIYKLNAMMIGVDENKLNSEVYTTHKRFIESFGGEKCILLESSFNHIQDDLRIVGKDLVKYGTGVMFQRTDFDYLKRKYFLLELRMYSIIEELKVSCSLKAYPVLFFYEIDQESSERQGFILATMQEKDAELYVFSFDIDYIDEPLVNSIRERYMVTTAPSIVINGTLWSGLHWEYQLRELIGNAV